MHKKTKQRTVATQSTKFFGLGNKILTPSERISKKPGFRNLLQKSVTIVSQESIADNGNLHFTREQNSKGVQAGLEVSFQRYRPYDQNLEFSFRKKSSFGTREEDSKTPNSELVNITEREGTRTSKPGTSKMLAGAYSSISVLSQMNEISSKRHEGSMTVIYGYGEKARTSSVTSSFPYFYGSQGSRRFSDETVLIEDYQSYDHTNVARRLDVDENHRSSMNCCTKPSHSSTEMLTRPLPLEPEVNSLDKEEIVCRICHEGEEIEPLIQPCLCKGSVGSVHTNCLKIWLEQSNTSRCELCNYPYAIRQTKKYPKCLSVKVFYKTVIDRRAMAYDVVSFVIITPLTLVGVVMCIQASLFSSSTTSGESGFQMGYITKVGMIMLSGTILIAYSVWLYTLLSFHYRTWKKWYASCYNVEVIPVRMTSEERLEAARRLDEDMRSRHLSTEQATALMTLLHSNHNQTFYPRPFSVSAVTPVTQHER